ncbi:transcriptional regulator BetI [Marinomonas mediterranea]|jgi:Transcriptional regulator|uniref:HTH-type transcriptional regulator BetI n=1 Tax=Marinomonas mediterranea (strain ATCC 700492 / JCM 21426 / NBRC 103028 / MMB-1) TaxID=717774 RepID=F2K488_MARM1|nr:transcriptional regulator BetI [Marinomonas mediterranea]ADZ92529.1 transcriptional regulator, TetR family [Marinomonas mediterranea MMB-1]WCN10475.1 transcriptional regulator BetI [Marinomonas mediterranea]WCN14523.1 transcriptional regulator BetI [Marinomonas mediterranea]WCN18574.1 transcriptional regulator BetI [Marinomonas mediterranea MMB-1]
MPKVGMPEIRKPQLVQAAIQAIDKYGFSGATVGVISKKAGVSPAIINHYFGGKNGLFEETMKTLIREFFEILSQERELVKNSTTKEKVMSVVRASINQAQTKPEIVKVWMGFWASSMHSPSLYRLQNVYARRLQTTLVIVLKEAFEGEEARNIAATVAAMIDGMWLRGSLAGDLDCDKAAGHIRDYLDLVFER